MHRVCKMASREAEDYCIEPASAVSGFEITRAAFTREERADRNFSLSLDMKGAYFEPGHLHSSKSLKTTFLLPCDCFACDRATQILVDTPNSRQAKKKKRSFIGALTLWHLQDLKITLVTGNPRFYIRSALFYHYFKNGNPAEWARSQWGWGWATVSRDPPYIRTMWPRWQLSRKAFGFLRKEVDGSISSIEVLLISYHTNG